MPLPEFNLSVRPLFYDALSGFFHPPSDQLGRAHTLGRLMYAAVEKGHYTPDDTSDPPNERFTYLPDWAPGVTVTAECELIDGHERRFSLGGISLIDSTDEGLMVLDATQPEEHFAHLGTQLKDRYLPIALGDTLDEAQEVIARTAQEFFDRFKR